MGVSSIPPVFLLLILSSVFVVNASPSLSSPSAFSSLRAAGKARGVYIGAAINYGILSAASNNDTEIYRQTFEREYSLATAENSCKFAPTQPQRDTYTLQQCTYLLNETLHEGGVFRAHNLIWGNSNPGWLINASYDADELRTVLRNHIGNVTQGMGKAPYCWDVVNEAVTNDDNNGTFKPVVPWYPTLENYVDEAFKAAREFAPPGVKLFYNDYGAEGLNSKSDRVYNMVQSMKQRGIPIDGVGLQMHIVVDAHPSFDDIENNIRRLGALGLEVHITEMDVRCTNCTAERQQLQAEVYAGVTKACLANSGVCTSIETWGFTDKHSWLNSQYDQPVPLPFDTEYRKKPAYYAMLKALQEK